MNDHALQNLLKEWQRLAETEGDAIRASDWKLLANCQKEIADLQPKISKITGSRPSQATATFQSPLIANLLEVEGRNYQLLAERRQLASLRIAQLDQTAHQLRRVHRSYAPSKSPPERLSLLS